MENLKTFEEFVNENYLAEKITSLTQVEPGQKYNLKIDKDLHDNMIYAGETDGVHIFNGASEADELTCTLEELTDIIEKGDITPCD
jgi:hypothetical protein